MKKSYWNELTIKRTGVSIVQINLGNACNQVCTHCHLSASPSGSNNMEIDAAKKISQKLIDSDIQNIEFTGGAPEMNPHLAFLIEELSKHDKNLCVRSNLTILDQPKYKDYIELYKKHKVNIISSLPCVTEEVVDKQRGRGAFEKSIRVLKQLNEMGFGESDLSIDLVYNPAADFLPSDQCQLELFYKKSLSEQYDIKFNNLFTMVNSPINRFDEFLNNIDKKDAYYQLLRDNHNPKTLDKIMCKNCMTIDYQGYAYDCDFNLALGLKMKSLNNVRFWDIDLKNLTQEIVFDEHCYACTVNQGSSCQGKLI
ncbi:MAG: arsenosugar biosynthesis radical SAM protein ArsS [Nitrospirae bacterium]|nr:arsenosugar biosynthesis radical SAM protein ArsS [Nitrospirota bacterium]MBF0542139.1 arsenosugar biosynthesis radical SAM protein ArsS [Nitrospirota bacterium]